MVNCLSALVSIEPNTVKAFVGTTKRGTYHSIFLKTLAMFGFMLTFVRVLSLLKSGYPVES